MLGTPFLDEFNSKIFLWNQSHNYSIYFNLAIEESIAVKFLESGYIGGLRFWTNSDAVVLGISNYISQNVHINTISKFKEDFPYIFISGAKPYSGVQIARRISGGGTVFHSPKNLNFSIFASIEHRLELYPVKNSYCILLGLVCKALSKQGIYAQCQGSSDISIELLGKLKKISGNAQFRKKNCLVHHGTLILDSSILQDISTHLVHPPEEPEYRQKRTHSDFVAALPESFSTNKFKEDLSTEFCKYMGIDSCKLNDDLPFSFSKKVLENAERLMIEKYLTPEFIYTRD